MIYIRNWDPAFLSVYEVILADALQSEGISVKRQKAVPITYKALKFDEGFRADVIAESKVIIEIKSVGALLRVHAKQLLTYLKLSGLRLGYLINVREPHLKAGIK
jgi:GxxExxY protein